MDAEAAQSNLFMHYEENVIFAAPEKRPLPVAIVTGFLGSGKTTLLKQLLDNRCNLRIAVITHDLATINMDATLIANHSTDGNKSERISTSEGTVRALGGCADCPEFETQLKAVIKETLADGIDRDEIDYLVLETSGAADPRRIVSALDMTFGPCTRARLDRVIALVDAEDLSRNSAQFLKPPLSPDAALQAVQLSCADVVVMNKVDLLDPSMTASALQRLEEFCPQAHVLSCSYGKVSVPQLLDVSQPQKLIVARGGKEVLPTNWSVPQQMKSLRQSTGDRLSNDIVPVLGFTHSASHHVIEWCCESDRIYLARLQWFMMSCLPRWRKGLKRAKGIVRLYEDTTAHTELHVSGRLRYESTRGTSSASGASSTIPSTSLVLIFANDFPQTNLTSVRTALDALLEPPREVSKRSTNERAKALQTTQPVFDILDPPSAISSAAEVSLIRFRLTGRSRYGISPDVDLAEPPYRIDLDAMNNELARLVNLTQGGSFICMGQGYDKESGKEVLALLWPANLDDHSCAGVDPASEIPPAPVASPFDMILSILSTEAEKVLMSTFRGVTSCICGS